MAIADRNLFIALCYSPMLCGLGLIVSAAFVDVVLIDGVLNLAGVGVGLVTFGWIPGVTAWEILKAKRGADKGEE